MRIVNVSTFVLRQRHADAAAYGGSSKGFIPYRASLLVRVRTDDGLEGWGEGGQSGPPELPRTVVDQLLGPAVLGRDPFDNEPIWDGLYELTRDYGQRGVVLGALAGLDIALWDLKGKAVGQPICKLLGGVHRTTVTPYATGLYYKGAAASLDERKRGLAEEACGYVAAGFKGMKMKIGLLSPREDVELVGHVREAIGPDVRLAVDANHAYNAHTAVAIGRELERFDLAWFEEPVQPEDLEGYVEVKAKLNIPISGGECSFTSYDIRDIISRRAVHIIQPDTCAAGGLTECKRIAALARAWGLQYYPHVWGSVVGLAASIHLLASLPPCPPTARPTPFVQEPVLEYDRNPSPLREALSKEPIEMIDGVLPVPTGPGLGIDIDTAALEEYSALKP
jgi:D-galactarolactone cycloisomerase